VTLSASMETKTFADLALNQELLDAINDLGFESPSPIQAATIPTVMAGHDVIGLSQTGSGKTAAFVLPALQQIDVKQRKVQVLILTPTRELSVQVCEEVSRLGKYIKGLSAVPVYGGAPIERQIRSLKDGAHIIVGTPGRIMDHMRRGTFQPNTVRVAILDEADRMLDMGFSEDMETILGAIPEVNRQTLFFSATMNKNVERLIQKFGKEPRKIQIAQKSVTVSTIEQGYYEVRTRSKTEVLSRILDIEKPRLAIVFCNTKRAVDECTETLLIRGFAADRLHGDITQAMRERVLQRFRDSTIEILVATDVAARGLDIDDVDIVFNYDLPHDSEDYVHRIGRTGRAGRSGRALSFCFGRDIYRLEQIERYTRQTIERLRVPTQEQLEGRRADQIFDKIRDLLESGNFDKNQPYFERLLDQGHSSSDIAGALFAMLREQNSRDGSEQIHEDSPHYDDSRGSTAPKRQSGGGGGGGGRGGFKGGFKGRFRGKKSSEGGGSGVPPHKHHGPRPDKPFKKKWKKA